MAEARILLLLLLPPSRNLEHHQGSTSQEQGGVGAMHPKQRSGALSGVQWVLDRLDRCVAAMYVAAPRNVCEEAAYLRGLRTRTSSFCTCACGCGPLPSIPTLSRPDCRVVRLSHAPRALYNSIQPVANHHGVAWVALHITTPSRRTAR
ncbi:uncharacterized protein CTRU02_200395 [Colletotrichum truncatum]|uniref:Uncharacterized protein n=1 Tax=Colletotrichum truncatum TaxID=5467 RepID=A0ACC3ZEE2_COLTU|nr:uncharacterized protein CTRU02_00154 [Colletotrichum truncatum]KAF6801405.1 hypothetical protein CTRU02_00154 [Colletotrichum truncatum]